MDISSILGVLAAGNNASQIGKQFNVDANTVNNVITSALPTLIGAMQKNASTEAGAASLLSALTSHSGDKAVNLSQEGLADGGKILSHILGNNSGSVFSALAKQTGTSNTQVSGILASVAPMLLGLLGNNQKSSGTSVSGLGGMLGGLLAGGGSTGSSSAKGGLGNLLGGALGDKNNNGIPDILEGFVK